MKTMKNFIFLFALTTCTFMACKKSDVGNCTYNSSTAVATSSEISYLQNYITVNSITAVQHPSGVFYTINNAGSGSSPDVCSNTTVKYTGRVLGGSVFDSNQSSTGVRVVLGELILGWQRVLPMLKEGGSITLYIPPSLGYGASAIRDNAGNVLIPANSYLQFEIDLLDVL
jgi:FKBP-type peptidyl-prolyl cis-trans isomerase FkpA